MSRFPDPPRLGNTSRFPDLVSRKMISRGRERGQRGDNSTNRKKTRISGGQNRKFGGKNRNFRGKKSKSQEKMTYLGGKGLSLEPFGPFPSGERHFSEFIVSRTISRFPGFPDSRTSFLGAVYVLLDSRGMGPGHNPRSFRSVSVFPEQMVRCFRNRYFGVSEVFRCFRNRCFGVSVGNTGNFPKCFGNFPKSCGVSEIPANSFKELKESETPANSLKEAPPCEFFQGGAPGHNTTKGWNLKWNTFNLGAHF